MNARYRRGWLYTAVALLCACSSDPDTALELHLQVDATLNSEQEVLGQIDRVQLVLDAGQAGFSGASTPDRDYGPFRATDVDEDGVPELLLERPVTGALPLLRLLPGNNGDKRFRITAWGLDGTQRVAGGEVEAASFTTKERKPLDVPFNLLAEHRAPRVLTATVNPAQIAAVVTFSKKVKVPAGSLRLLLKATKEEVPGVWSLADHSYPELGQDTTGTAASLQLDQSCPSLSPGVFVLEADAQIEDLQGTALDQDASRSGPDGYSLEVTIPGTSTGTACVDPEPCRTDAECQKLGGSHMVCRYGVCVPAGSDDCDNNCQPGYVCVQGECVLDDTFVSFFDVPSDHPYFK